MTVPYAVLDDLSIYGLNASVLSLLTPIQQQAALDAASDLIDGYLNSKFKLPLVTFGKSLTQKVCEIASWNLLSIRGFDPEDPADAEVKKRYDVALQWLQDIKNGEITPNVVDSGTGQLGGPGILQSNTQPSSQPSPGGTAITTSLPDGTVIVTGAPRQRGWR